MYILNGVTLEKNVESKLFELSDAVIQLQVTEGNKLKKQFNIENKTVRVVINKEEG